jgi:hypothetical protein
MAGNARGKLKEHFEGIHRNLDWCVVHVNKSLTLIAEQLSFTEALVAVKGDAEKEEEALMQYPLYRGMKALGASIQQLDELAGDVYKNI